MKTIGITYAGHCVALPDHPDYAKFYRKLASGTWEPRTFETLSRNLDADTVYVDIGAWIGVTPMWAAQLAKAVVAVEPDPRCVKILRSLAAGCGNVTIIEGALAADESVVINAVDGFGSSETTILDIGNGDHLNVCGISLTGIMGHAAGSPVFVKIDIEGYEYMIAGELAALRGYPLRGIQIAIHPQLYEKSLTGNRFSRRIRTAWATWRLAKSIGGILPGPRIARFASLSSYVIRGILLRRKPKGADLVYGRLGSIKSQPLP